MANVKKIYRCYRIGIELYDEDLKKFTGDYERLTVVGVDESSCDSLMTAHRTKYVHSNDSLTTVESVESTTEPLGVKQESFINGQIWF